MSKVRLVQERLNMEQGVSKQNGNQELGKDGTATDTDSSEKLISAEIRHEIKKQEETQPQDQTGQMVQRLGRQPGPEGTGLAVSGIEVRHKQHKRSCYEAVVFGFQLVGPQMTQTKIGRTKSGKLINFPVLLIHTLKLLLL